MVHYCLILVCEQWFWFGFRARSGDGWHVKFEKLSVSSLRILLSVLENANKQTKQAGSSVNADRQLYSIENPKMLSQDKKLPKSVGDFALYGTAQSRSNPLVHIGPSFEKTTKNALRIPQRVSETGELINFAWTQVWTIRSWSKVSEWGIYSIGFGIARIEFRCRYWGGERSDQSTCPLFVELHRYLCFDVGSAVYIRVRFFVMVRGEPVCPMKGKVQTFHPMAVWW